MKIFLICIFSLINSALAFNVKVKTPKKNYTLSYELGELNFDSSLGKTKIFEKPCNKIFLKKFQETFEAHLMRKEISKKSKIELEYLQKTYLIWEESTLGNFLVSMPKKIAHLQLKTRANCD